MRPTDRSSLPAGVEHVELPRAALHASAHHGAPIACRLVEMSFEELSGDPIAAVGRVYFELGLAGFDERVRPRVAALQAGKAKGAAGGPKLQGYRKNAHKPLPDGLRELVAERWAAYAKAWGYSCEQGAPGQL